MSTDRVVAKPFGHLEPGRLLRVSLACLALVLPGKPSPAQCTAQTDLAVGIQQVKEGDFDAALLTLDGVARTLEGQPDRSKDLGQAYLYLGVAYAGLHQDALAKTRIQQALAHDPQLRMSPNEFSLKVIKLFNEARAAEYELKQAQQKAGTKKGKGALIVVGLGGAAAAGIALTVPHESTAPAASGPNREPTASFTVTPPGQTAIAGVTVLRFTATASDPDGDPLTFQWTFGDGTTGTGSAVSHVFNSEGSFTVSLAVRDGRGGTTTVDATVQARTLTGQWREDGSCYIFDFLQVGSGLTGQFHTRGCPRFQWSSPLVGGIITSPTRVTFSYLCYTYRPQGCDFDGTADQSLNAITTVTGLVIRRE